MRSVKEVLTKLGPEDWRAKLATYLLTQHATPCLMTNRIPPEMLIGWRLWTNLNRLHPDYCLEKPPDSRGGAGVFTEGDRLYAQNYGGGDPRWLTGQVIAVTEPHSYKVLLEDGYTWHRHVDQLQHNQLPPSDTGTSEA